MLGRRLSVETCLAVEGIWKMITLHELRLFARQRLVDYPTRIHQRALGEDGAPQWTREFLTWISASPFAVRTVETHEPCDHRGAEADACNDCAVFADDGSILSSTGQRVKRSVLYKYPERAALSRLAKLPVAAGLPRLDEVVLLASREGFNIPLLVELYPALIDNNRALRHVIVALRKFKQLYTAEPPVRSLRRLRTDCD